MAKKISDLPAATILAAADLIEVVQSGVSKKATVELARGYKVYTAILAQSGSNPPVPTILQNTIGEIVWSRGGAGDYIGTLAGAFPVGKTWLTPSTIYFNISDILIQFDSNTEDVVTVGSTQAQAPADGLLNNQIVTGPCIEIRVYP